MLKVLVSSSDSTIGSFLGTKLSPARFRVLSVQTGTAFLETVRREHPEIAVIDCIEQRSQSAQMEIAFLKDMNPDARIIAISEKSSTQDGEIIEQGLFYYMTGKPGDDLIRIVEAAAHAISRKSQTDDSRKKNP